MDVLTRAGWALAAGSVAVALTGRILGVTELFLLGGVGAALLVVAVALVGSHRLRLEVSREVRPRRVHAGEVARVDLRVRNLRSRRTPVLTVVDPVEGAGRAELRIGPLEPGEAAVGAYRLPTRRRGVLRIGPLTVTVSDPFGLAAVHTRAAGTAEVTVLPATEPVRVPVATRGAEPVPARLRGARVDVRGEDFYALRPYATGDDLRRVHWRSSARRGELVVRQDAETPQGRTTVLVDHRRDSHDTVSLERAVSLAASVVEAAGRRGDLVRMVTSDGTDSGFGAGRAHLDALLEVLAVLGPGRPADLGNLTEGLLRGGLATGGLVAVLGAASSVGERERIARLRRRYAPVTIAVCGWAGATPRVEPLDGATVVAIPPEGPLAPHWDAAHRSRPGRPAPGRGDG